MRLLDAVKARLGIIIARVPEIYATVSNLQCEAAQNKIPIGNSLSSPGSLPDIALFSPTKGLIWATGAEIGNEVEVKDLPAETMPGIEGLITAIYNQEMPGVFIFPVYEMLLQGGLVPLLAPATSYLRAAHDTIPKNTVVILEIGQSMPIPTMLGPNVPVVNVPLPDKNEITTLYPKCTNADSMTGLNRCEVSMASKLCSSLDEITNFKRDRIMQSDVLEIHEYTELDDFKYIIGLEKMKSFALKVAGLSEARGIMIVGIPGTGKSVFARALGRHLGWPTVEFKLDSIFHKFIGESEERMLKAIQIIDRLGKCIIFIDEIEKSISGIHSSAVTDGGTGSRVFSMFLKWLSDHTSPAYVIATCNNIGIIPAEFKRAERWDSMFYTDIPNEKTALVIAKLWFKYFKNKRKYTKADIKNFSGAEIKTLARISRAFKTVKEAGEYLPPPIFETMAGEIRDSRKWAARYAQSASEKTATGKEMPTIGFKI